MNLDIKDFLGKFLAQYKKFETNSAAKDYLNEKVKIQKTVETKSSTKKPKAVNNTPMNLIKATIERFYPTTNPTSDTTANDQGKDDKFQG